MADHRGRARFEARMIDIIRGVAVLGILAINIPDVAYLEDLVLAFHLTDPERGWNYWAGFSLEVLFSGKMRGRFFSSGSFRSYSV